MKKLFSGFVLASALFFFLACGSSTSKEAQSGISLIAEENKATLHLAVEGMVCAKGCAKGIEKELNTVQGIGDCKVDFEAGIAKVVYDKTKLNSEDIMAIIEDMNDGQYTVSIASAEATQQEGGSATGSEKLRSYGEKATQPTFILPLLLSYILNSIPA